VPLYVAIGAGCGLCVYACGRNLMNYPDIVCVALSLTRRAGSNIDV
jgi:ferredoxin